MREHGEWREWQRSRERVENQTLRRGKEGGRYVLGVERMDGCTRNGRTRNLKAENAIRQYDTRKVVKLIKVWKGKDNLDSDENIASRF